MTSRALISRIHCTLSANQSSRVQCIIIPINSASLVRFGGISGLFGRETLKVPQSKPEADFLGKRSEMLD